MLIAIMIGIVVLILLAVFILLFINDMYGYLYKMKADIQKINERIDRS